MPNHSSGFCSECGTALLPRKNAKGKCKPCYDREYRAKNFDRLRERQRAWARAHPDIVRVSSQKWVAANPEKRKATGAAYYRRNIDKIRAYWATRKEATKRYKDAYYAANKVRLDALRKRWQLAHPEKRRAIAARYRRNHREQDAQYRAEYYIAHRDYILRQGRLAHPKRYAAKGEQIRERTRNYLRANPELMRERRHVRRARELAAFVESVSMAEIFTRDAGICQICKQAVDRKQASLDHILPLVYGGTHEPKNVRLTHRKCNIARQHLGAAQLRLLG